MKHWEEFLPKMFKNLKEEGILIQSAYEAQHYSSRPFIAGLIQVCRRRRDGQIRQHAPDTPHMGWVQPAAVTRARTSVSIPRALSALVHYQMQHFTLQAEQHDKSLSGCQSAPPASRTASSARKPPAGEGYPGFSGYRALTASIAGTMSLSPVTMIAFS